VEVAQKKKAKRKFFFKSAEYQQILERQQKAQTEREKVGLNKKQAIIHEL